MLRSFCFTYDTCSHIILNKISVPQNQDKWKYNGPMNSTIPGGLSMQPNNGKSHQMLGHNQHPSHLQNHINPQNHLNQNVLNHALNQTGVPMQMIQGSVYDHLHQSVNVNGVKPNEQLVYLGQPHLMAPQNQYMTRNTTAVS